MKAMKSIFLHKTSMRMPKIFFHQIKVSGLLAKLRSLQWVYFAKEAWLQAEKAGVDIIMGTGKCLGVNVFQPHGEQSERVIDKTLYLLEIHFTLSLKKLANCFSPKHIVAKNIESQQYGNKDCQFVAISEMVKSHMLEFYQVPEERISLVYNGIDTSRFSPVTEEQKLTARKKTWSS